MTEESIRELFNQTVPQFIKTSTIHDLCSTQIGSAICRKGWITNDDSIMVRTIIVVRERTLVVGLDRFQ